MLSKIMDEIVIWTRVGADGQLVGSPNSYFWVGGNAENVYRKERGST